MERRSSYFPKMAIGKGIMRSRRPWVNRFHSPPDQAKKKYHREIRKCSPNPAEMTGDSCMARAVVPRTAAAVDHADTELIGQSGRRISLWCFLLAFSHHIIEGIPRICPILCIYSHFVSLTPCTEILHCAQNDLPRKNTLDSMKKNHTDQV